MSGLVVVLQLVERPYGHAPNSMWRVAAGRVNTYQVVREDNEAVRNVGVTRDVRRHMSKYTLVALLGAVPKRFQATHCP